MRKLVTVLLFTCCMPSLYSQAVLTFCTYVEQGGHCIFDNKKFITSPDSASGRIFMEVKSTDALGAKLTYKIFSVGKNSEEKLVQSLDQNLQADWMMAWEPYVFPTNTKYSVKVYNEANIVICSKSFELVGGN